MKNMPDGSLIVMQPHSNHERENNDMQLVDDLKNILKRRAASDSVQLKLIYDEECRR